MPKTTNSENDVAIIFTPFKIISISEYKRLREIETQAKWVIKGSQISRQAALNALPDLTLAVGNPYA